MLLAVALPSSAWATETKVTISDAQTEMLSTSVYLTDAQNGTLVVESIPSGWKKTTRASDKSTFIYYSSGLYKSGTATIKVRFDKIGKVDGKWVSARLTFSNMKGTKLSSDFSHDGTFASGVHFDTSSFRDGIGLLSLDQADVQIQLLDYSTKSAISLNGAHASFGSLNYASDWGSEGVGYITSGNSKAYVLKSTNLTRNSSGIWMATSKTGWEDDHASKNYNRNSVSFGIVDAAPKFRLVFPNNSEAFYFSWSFTPLTAATPPSPTKSATISG